LGPPPAGRSRRAYLHRPYSTESGTSTYIEIPSSFGTHAVADGWLRGVSRGRPRRNSGGYGWAEATCWMARPTAADPYPGGWRGRCRSVYTHPRGACIAVNSGPGIVMATCWRRWQPQGNPAIVTMTPLDLTLTWHAYRPDTKRMTLRSLVNGDQ
jgi:hypothetical protein